MVVCTQNFMGFQRTTLVRLRSRGNQRHSLPFEAGFMAVVWRHGQHDSIAMFSPA